jgi:glycosyltransferase involved in cell wall biosynthesis
MPEQNLAILIPAFNAATTLDQVLETLIPLEYPILVINDGSSDKTAEIVSTFSAVRLLSHPVNRGKGAALKSGFRELLQNGVTHVLTLDADGQHPQDCISQFIDECRCHPEAILVGNRFGEVSIGEMPWIRWLSNSLSSRIISTAVRTRIPDAQCGMRVYPLAAVTRFDLESDGYALETEILVRAGRAGIPIRSLPIGCLYPHGTDTSRYRAIVDSWRITRTLIRCIRS